MSEVSEFLPFASDFKSILGISMGLTTLSMLGFMPRLGVSRALRLGLRRIISNRFQSASPQSVRTDEIAKLKLNINIIDRGLYIVVIGWLGVGKTHLIDTALQNEFGVVKYGTQSGDCKTVIMNDVLREITGIRSPFFDLHSNAHRVIKFHRLFFQSPPIVVISVPERGPREEYAMLTAAVRGLTDEFKLKVLVDGTPDSIPPDTLATKRQVVLFVHDMRQDQLESIAGYNKLVTFMRENKINDGVWEALGGNPARYISLNSLYRGLVMDNAPKDAIVAAIKKHVYWVLMITLNKIVFDCSANTKSIIEMLRERKMTRIELTELIANGYSFDYPNMVFRKATRDYHCYIEPTSSAVSLIIANHPKSSSDLHRLVETLFTAKVDTK